ncbi:hypothetical protein [Comamonas antarctica]|uniref:hypothetical protein n=1 Tax=Comamonas antarctica TaxID=2743470 RepID=UPI0028E5AD6B|nr:hypothetical protein [Comamonas antarctica]
MNVTAINVFIEVDGKQTIAFINKDSVEMFIGMLPAFQTDQPKAAKLQVLPEQVALRLQATRQALAVSMGLVPGAAHNHRHDFRPNKKYPWFCADCGYAPHDELMHNPKGGADA